MKLIVNPPTPWPNWQALVSTRKLAGHHGARGGGWRTFRMALLLTQASRRNPGGHLRSTFNYVDLREEGKVRAFALLFTLRGIFFEMFLLRK